MMRAAERPSRGQGAVPDFAGADAIIDTSASSDGDSGGRIEGSRAGQHDLRRRVTRS